MARFSRDDPDIVYSSDGGDRRQRPQHPPSQERRGDGVVRVALDAKGRRGKTVTTVSGLPGGPADLAAFAAELKRRCGSGGAVKDGVLEIQGDHRAALVPLLEALGLRVKRD